jgi:predicted transcriptional regulator
MTSEAPPIECRLSTTVICKVPQSMLSAINEIAHATRRTRSALIREAIQHRIAFYDRHERQIIHDLQRQTDAHFGVTDHQYGGQ